MQLIKIGKYLNLSYYFWFLQTIENIKQHYFYIFLKFAFNKDMSMRSPSNSHLNNH
jgi:hypothetical protein